MGSTDGKVGEFVTGKVSRREETHAFNHSLQDLNGGVFVGGLRQWVPSDSGRQRNATDKLPWE